MLPWLQIIPVCYEGDFMMSLSDDKQVDVIDAFNTNIQIFGRYFKHN